MPKVRPAGHITHEHLPMPPPERRGPTMTNDPEQIRRNIERTRAELSENVNALGDKVNPGSIAKRQVGRVRGAAVSVKDALLSRDSNPTDNGVAGTVGDTVSGAP